MGGQAIRKPREDVESLPGDGWLRLKPGAFVEWHQDRPVTPSHPELIAWMSNIRSGVLSASFDIENELILIALADKFGSNDHGSVGSDYFKQEQEWREDHRLGIKIGRVKSIIRAKKDKEEADSIVKNLADYRHLRNLPAHYPCWVEPANDEVNQQTTAFNLFIGDRSHIWLVDTDQVCQWKDMIFKVRVSVENLRREIVGAPSLNADGTPPQAEDTLSQTTTESSSS